MTSPGRREFGEHSLMALQGSADERAADRRAIRVSLIGAALFATFGLSFAVWSGSQAVLLDGAYNLITALMVVVALRITSLLDRPASPDRPAGFAALEPMYVLAKGLTLLALTIVVLISNLIVLATGGTELDLGVVVVYVALAVSGNLVVWLLIRRERKRNQTPLIQVEEQSWMVNTIVSAAIAVSFVLVVVLQDGVLEPFVPYVDQIVVVVVCAASLPVPIAAIRSSLRDLLLFGPDEEVRTSIDAAVGSRLLDWPLERWSTEVFTMGRHLWVSLTVTPTASEIEAAFGDELRRSLLDELDSQFGPVRLDVVITTESMQV